MKLSRFALVRGLRREEVGILIPLPGFSLREVWAEAQTYHVDRMLASARHAGLFSAAPPPQPAKRGLAGAPGLAALIAAKIGARDPRIVSPRTSLSGNTTSLTAKDEKSLRNNHGVVMTAGRSQASMKMFFCRFACLPGALKEDARAGLSVRRALGTQKRYVFLVIRDETRLSRSNRMPRVEERFVVETP